MLRSLVVFLAVLSVVFAEQALMKSDPKPDKYKNVEGCYIKDEDLFLQFGQIIPSKKYCSKYFCGSDYITVSGCGAVSASPPCKVITETDYNLYPHPECCPKLSCE